MTRNPERPARPRKLAAALMASALVLTPVLTTPAQAFFFGGGGRIVYDPRNHAENILSAARALEQINNQIAQIQNQAQMLMNDALNLANLPHSSLAQLQDAIGNPAPLGRCPKPCLRRSHHRTGLRAGLRRCSSAR